MKRSTTGYVGFAAGAAAVGAAWVFWVAFRPGAAPSHGENGHPPTANPAVGNGHARSMTAAPSSTDPASRRPSPSDAQNPGRAELLREISRLRAEIVDLRRRPDETGPDRSNVVELTREELIDMSDRCELAWNMPGLGDGGPLQVGRGEAADLGMADRQREAMNRALRDHDAAMRSAIRRLYIEVTGDEDGAATISPTAAMLEIRAKSPGRDTQVAFQRIARERAGLQAPPDDVAGTPAVERLYRLMHSAGDRVERDIAAEIGSDLAHRWRLRGNGFHTSREGHDCPR